MKEKERLGGSGQEAPKGGKRDLWADILLYAVFLFYIVLLVLILFRQRHSDRSVNLVPFRTVFSYLLRSGTDPEAVFMRSLAASNIGGNIVIFIPLGVYIALFNAKGKIWQNTLLAVAVSAAAETVQFLFKLGITDIDDVLLNGFGGLIGVLICKLLARACKNDLRKMRRATAVLAPIAGVLSFAILILQNGV